MKKLLTTAALALFTTSLALADPTQPAGTIGFFNPYPKIDLKNWYISNGWTNGAMQNCEWLASAVSVNQSALDLTISNKGGSLSPYGCGELQSVSQYSYGTYQARIKTVAASGTVTNFFTYTANPTHDEIDFEFLGKNSHTVQLNYFVGGVGNHEQIITLPFDASAAFHTYAFTWTPTSITWLVDGKAVYQTKPNTKIPANKGKIYIELWAGSKSVDGWLGAFTYTKPLTAEYGIIQYIPLAK